MWKELWMRHTSVGRAFCLTPLHGDRVSLPGPSLKVQLFVLLYRGLLQVMLERSCTETTKWQTLGQTPPVPDWLFSVGAPPDVCSTRVFAASCWSVRAGPPAWASHVIRCSHVHYLFWLGARPRMQCIVGCRNFLLWRAPLLCFFCEVPWSRADLCSAVLRLRPGHPAYELVVRLAVEIDRVEEKLF